MGGSGEGLDLQDMQQHVKYAGGGCAEQGGEGSPLPDAA